MIVTVQEAAEKESVERGGRRGGGRAQRQLQRPLLGLRGAQEKEEAWQEENVRLR